MSGASFDAQPVVRRYAPRLVEVLGPLRYHDPARGLHILIPRGFISDGASVPSWCWGLLSADWITLLAFGLLHDLLFRRHAVVELFGELRLVPSLAWANRIGVEAISALEYAQPGADEDARRAALRRRARDQRWVRAGLFLGSRGSWQRKAVDWRPAA